MPAFRLISAISLMMIFAPEAPGWCAEGDSGGEYPPSVRNHYPTLDELPPDPTRRRMPISIHAGDRDRVDVPVSGLIEAGNARSVYVELPEGSLSRAQLNSPGIGNEQWQGTRKKELHFQSPKMKAGETIDAWAVLSDEPVRNRGYSWSGEPGMNRRLSCVQCHQGIGFPTTEYLRQEHAAIEAGRELPTWNPPTILPTTKGRDFRWHPQIQEYVTSACWQCHGRSMVQYEFGQSLDLNSPGSPSLPSYALEQGGQKRSSAFYQIYRMKGDRPFASPPTSHPSKGTCVPTCGLHFDFSEAMLRIEKNGAGVTESALCSNLFVGHSRFLAEEQGKFNGRHNLLLEWVAELQSQSPKESLETVVVAREERQVTIKNTRAPNRSLANWIDHNSRIQATRGVLHLDEATPNSGFRFVLPVDKGTTPQREHGRCWTAIRWQFEGDLYAAVCFSHPENLSSQPIESPSNPPIAEVGFRCSADLREGEPRLFRYRFWIQGGDISTSHIEAMRDDFLDPVVIEEKET